LELKTPRLYNAANTDDVRHAINWLREKYPENKLFAAGFSLGSQLLVKYLGEEGVNTPLSGAVSVSNPYEFEKSAVIVPKKPFYDIKLTRDSIRTITRQKHILSQHFDIEFEKVISLRKMRQFDEHVTCKMYGYETPDHYYRDACCHQRLDHISIPTLLVNANDDPLIDPEAIPKHTDNPNLVIAVTNKGGHVSFSDGLWPTKP
jgi:predicted alpha/beta-fold hydrolase